jgi:hypothetical protein
MRSLRGRYPTHAPAGTQFTCDGEALGSIICPYFHTYLDCGNVVNEKPVGCVRVVGRPNAEIDHADLYERKSLGHRGKGRLILTPPKSGLALGDSGSVMLDVGEGGRNAGDGISDADVDECLE